VNEGTKYPIADGGGKSAIGCVKSHCARFGTGATELVISSDSNDNTDSYCHANHASFNLPKAKGMLGEKDSSSINGGKKHFKCQQFEVYRVIVINIFLITFFRKNESLEKFKNFFLISASLFFNFFKLSNQG